MTVDKLPGKLSAAITIPTIMAAMIAPVNLLIVFSSFFQIALQNEATIDEHDEEKDACRIA